MARRLAAGAIIDTRPAPTRRNPNTACRYCGRPATVTCVCGAPICDDDATTWIDGNNAAITRAAREKCPGCEPPKYPRPYSLARAIERGDYDPDDALHPKEGT